MLDNLNKTYWLWILAVVITLASVVYQRTTGPSYPVRTKTQLPTGETVRAKFLTTHESVADAPIRVVVGNQRYSGRAEWRRVNSSDDWQTILLNRSGDTLWAFLPKQPPAGKIAYKVVLASAGGNDIMLTSDQVVMRYKGPVPITVLAPHVLFMFVAMLLATRTGLQALARPDEVKRLAILTAILLFAGGLILGPIVQKYAFGAYWTGWPFGHDLTDNKTALAMLMWLIAIWRDSKTKNGRWWYISATLVHLLVYLIPHIVLGSELDYTDPNSN